MMKFVSLTIILVKFLTVAASQYIEDQGILQNDPSIEPVSSALKGGTTDDDTNEGEICDPSQTHPCESKRMLCLWSQLDLIYRCTHPRHKKMNFRKPKDKEKERTQRKYMINIIKLPKSTIVPDSGSQAQKRTSTVSTTTLKEDVTQEKITLTKATPSRLPLGKETGVGIKLHASFTDTNKTFLPVNASRGQSELKNNADRHGSDDQKVAAKNFKLNERPREMQGKLEYLRGKLRSLGPGSQNRTNNQTWRDKLEINRRMGNLKQMRVQAKYGKPWKFNKGNQKNIVPRSGQVRAESVLDYEDPGPPNSTIPEYSGTLTWDGETEFSEICKTREEMQEYIANPDTSWDRKVKWSEEFRDQICDFTRFFYCVVVDEDISLTHVANYTVLEQQQAVEEDEPVCRCYDSSMAVVDDTCYIPADFGAKSDCGPHVTAPYPIIPWEDAPLLKPKCTPNSECRESQYWFGRRCSCKAGRTWNSQKHTCDVASRLKMSIFFVGVSLMLSLQNL